MSRVKLLNMTPDYLLSFCRGGAMVQEGLPKDATVVRVGYDADRDWVQMVVHSESFEDVPEGQKIPQAEVLVRTIFG